jgi:hypothetical protein
MGHAVIVSADKDGGKVGYRTFAAMTARIS